MGSDLDSYNPNDEWTEAKYSTADLCRITGEKRNRIITWTANSIYRAEQESSGTGYPTKHSLRGALQVLILSRLGGAGVKLRTAAKAVKMMNDAADGKVEGKWFHYNYIDNADAKFPFWLYFTLDGNNVTARMEDTTIWPDCIGINLSNLINQIQAEL